MPSRDEVLSVLKAHEAELRARGVARVALFGSLARGEARPDSDVDLMVEIDPAAGLDLWRYAGVVEFIRELFDTLRRCRRPLDHVPGRAPLGRARRAPCLLTAAVAPSWRSTIMPCWRSASWRA